MVAAKEKKAGMQLKPNCEKQLAMLWLYKNMINSTLQSPRGNEGVCKRGAPRNLNSWQGQSTTRGSLNLEHFLGVHPVPTMPGHFSKKGIWNFLTKRFSERMVFKLTTKIILCQTMRHTKQDEMKLKHSCGLVTSAIEMWKRMHVNQFTW